MKNLAAWTWINKSLPEEGIYESFNFNQPAPSTNDDINIDPSTDFSFSKCIYISFMLTTFIGAQLNNLVLIHFGEIIIVPVGHITVSQIMNAVHVINQSEPPDYQSELFRPRCQGRIFAESRFCLCDFCLDLLQYRLVFSDLRQTFVCSRIHLNTFLT